MNFCESILARRVTCHGERENYSRVTDEDSPLSSRPTVQNGKYARYHMPRRTQPLLFCFCFRSVSVLFTFFGFLRLFLLSSEGHLLCLPFAVQRAFPDRAIKTFSLFFVWWNARSFLCFLCFLCFRRFSRGKLLRGP